MRTPMRLLLRERILPLVILLGIGAAVPVGLLLVFGHRMVMFGTPVHFVGVGVSHSQQQPSHWRSPSWASAAMMVASS
jgi:hypothetical protein